MFSSYFIYDNVKQIFRFLDVEYRWRKDFGCKINYILGQEPGVFYAQLFFFCICEIWRF